MHEIRARGSDLAALALGFVFNVIQKDTQKVVWL